MKDKLDDQLIETFSKVGDLLHRQVMKALDRQFARRRGISVHEYRMEDRLAILAKASKIETSDEDEPIEYLLTSSGVEALDRN